MTYSTCRIDVLKDAEVSRHPDFGVVREVLLRDLPNPSGSGHYWLPVVSAWANGRERPIEYLDNCWIEVEVTSSELTDFLRDIYSSAEISLAGELSGMHRYVLIAEEF